MARRPTRVCCVAAATAMRTVRGNPGPKARRDYATACRFIIGTYTATDTTTPTNQA